MEKAKEYKITGLPEAAIKIGVKTYFAANQLASKIETKAQSAPNKAIEIVEDIEPKLKKKVKKN